MSGCAAPAYRTIGDLLGYTDSVMGAWSFGNDGRNGLTSGSASSLAYSNQTQCWMYDSFGNRTASMAAAGAACQTSITATVNYTSANQFSGYNYDLSGNLLADGIGNFFQYDANGMVKWASGASYVYDGEGNRVEKSGSSAMDTVYFGGRPIARLAGGAWTDLVYGAGGLLAEVPGTQAGAPLYRIADHLGTSVGTLAPGPPADPCLVSNGCIVASIMDYAPFGQVFAGSTSDPFKFTGKERDAESGLDYFGARYYGSTMGRFTSPDWSEDPVPVPYAALSDPQSLNLYSLVRNNPLSSLDSDGHSCDPDVYSTDKSGNMVVTAGQCHYDFSLFLNNVNQYLQTAANLAPPSNGTSKPAPQAPNNGTQRDPCAYMGRAMPPSAYAAQGAASNVYQNPLGFAADAATGWTGFLNSQPLNSGSVQQNATYGNYVFGVYMQAAGLTLSQALFGADAFAAIRKLSNPGQYAGQQMAPNYPFLPTQNVANITNGFNAQASGTTCHF